MSTASSGPDPFLRVAMVSTALAFGFMCATVFSVSYATGGLSFQFGWKSVAAFLGGAGIAWGFWRVILSRTASRQKILLSAVGLLALGLLCFLFPMRFVSDANRRDLVQGLLLALGALSVVGIVFYRLVCFLERDDRRARTGK